MAASRCFQRVLEMEPDNSQAQQEVSLEFWSDGTQSHNIDMMICYRMSVGKVSDTERFKKRSTRFTGNSQKPQRAKF